MLGWQADAAHLAARGEVNTSIALNDSYIYHASLYPVDKAAALAYLDEGGPAPERFARVIAVRGASTPPDVMEYKASRVELLAALSRSRLNVQ